MSFDGQTSLKEMLEDMSLPELMRVIAVIKERDDIQEIFVVTTKEQEEMSEHFKELFKDISDEPA